MRVAAIDIGSNSIHLMVVELHPDGSYDTIDRAKDMVGLASGVLADGRLGDDAKTRAMECLLSFRTIIDAYGVDHTVCVATAAVRAASNGQAFVDQVKAECDIDVRVISGEEEAHLIYLGARRHIDWRGRRALIVDIGGGSVEFIVGGQHDASFFASLPMGVRRLTELFLNTDPPTKLQLRALRAHIENRMDAFVREELSDHHFDFMVGTSGTFNRLALMAAARQKLDAIGSHGLVVHVDEVRDMGRELSGMTRAERETYPALDTKRVDTIVAGAQIVKYITRAVGFETFQTCDHALRDGLIESFAQQHGNQRVRTYNDGPEMRRRSVMRLFRKFNVLGAHPRQVANLAVSLFDQLESLHGLGAQSRELLEFGALTHDLGHVISQSKHHKHSAYIVENAPLAGFSVRERQTIALLARFHRKRLPSRSEDSFAGWSKEEFEAFYTLVLLLRLANSLDRSRTNNIGRVQATLSDDQIRVGIAVRSDPSLELWAADHVRPLLEAHFGKEVTFEAAPERRPKPWII